MTAVTLRYMPEIIKSDTAIVGGGITGLYTCYKLNQLKGAGHTISLFEGTDRFGGRIETVDMGGFLAEYGPMRFEKLAQPLLMDLIAELGLETKPFVPYTAADDPDSLFDLTFDESGGKRRGKMLTTLDLLALGILRLLKSSGGDMDNPRDPRHWEWWSTLDEDYYSYVRSEAQYDGTYLHQMGLWNALVLVLSHKAVSEIIRYGTFYHCIHLNVNAAEWIIFWLRGLHPLESLVGVKQGSEALIHELIKMLSFASKAELLDLGYSEDESSNPRSSEFESSKPKPSVSLYLNHRLTALYPQSEGKVLLEFVADQTMVKALVRHVVLALPFSPLMKLRSFLPGCIRDLVNSVIPVPLLKCFFIDENPWWDESTPPQTRASSTPAREIHYYSKTEGGRRRGMVMVYGDAPSMHYWMPYVRQKEHLRAELNGNPRLIEEFLRYFRSNPDSLDPKEMETEVKLISCFGIRDWSREPFEAGCHVWKAGARSKGAIDDLTAFSLDGASPSKDLSKNIHICGEAYSDFQGFIEGGLRTALQVIRQIP